MIYDDRPPDLKSILLLEDHVAARDSVRMGLVQFGFHVIEAADGDEAVSLLQSEEVQIEAVVIDLVRPGLFDHDIADRLLEMSPCLHMIFISQHSRESLHDCDDLKPDDVFFQKPFYPSKIADAIYEMLGIPNPFRLHSLAAAGGRCWN